MVVMMMVVPVVMMVVVRIHYDQLRVRGFRERYSKEECEEAVHKEFPRRYDSPTCVRVVATRRMWAQAFI
jgi:hypothetical protein